MTTLIPSANRPDVVLVGAGIMSATLAVILKEIDPGMRIEIYEVLGSAAGIDISKAPQVNTEFDLSRQLWSYLVKKGAIKDPQSFIHPVLFLEHASRRSLAVLVTTGWSIPTTNSRLRNGSR